MKSSWQVIARRLGYSLTAILIMVSSRTCHGAFIAPSLQPQRFALPTAVVPLWATSDQDDESVSDDWNCNGEAADDSLMMQSAPVSIDGGTDLTNRFKYKVRIIDIASFVIAGVSDIYVSSVCTGKCTDGSLCK